MENQLTEMAQKMAIEMGLSDKIKVTLKDYRKRVACVSINEKNIRINKKVLDDEELLTSIIRHELLHIKTNSRWHGPEFFEDE